MDLNFLIFFENLQISKNDSFFSKIMIELTRPKKRSQIKICSLSKILKKLESFGGSLCFSKNTKFRFQ
jgi:hypothetical protein